MWEALFFLMFGLGTGVAAVVYRMRAMEKGGEFDRNSQNRR